MNEYEYDCPECGAMFVSDGEDYQVCPVCEAEFTEFDEEMDDFLEEEPEE